MAHRKGTGQPADLKEEIMSYINGVNGFVSRFDILDWILEVRWIMCEAEELETAIAEIEQETGQHFPEGSLGESIHSLSREDMKSSLLAESTGTILPTFDASEHTM